MRADGLYRFFAAASSGDDLMLFEDGREVARFHFPRQSGGERLCLADYVRDVESGETDYVALFAVTCGAGVRALAERWKDEGQLPPLPHAPGAGDRVRGGVRRDAARAAAHAVGLPRSART